MYSKKFFFVTHIPSFLVHVTGIVGLFINFEATSTCSTSCYFASYFSKFQISKFKTSNISNRFFFHLCHRKPKYQYDHTRITIDSSTNAFKLKHQSQFRNHVIHNYRINNNSSFNSNEGKSRCINTSN